MGSDENRKEFWSGKGARFLDDISGDVVVPGDMASGSAAVVSMEKAYIHFCLSGFPNRARLMKRVILKPSVFSSDV